MNKLNTRTIVYRGYLYVNIPVIVIILLVSYCLISHTEINSKISILIATASGWIYWEYSIKKWVKWALENDVKPERLLKIGQLTLLLWNRKQIDEALKNK